MASMLISMDEIQSGSTHPKPKLNKLQQYTMVQQIISKDLSSDRELKKKEECNSAIQEKRESENTTTDLTSVRMNHRTVTAQKGAIIPLIKKCIFKLYYGI